jgi:hypothetical protein
MRRMLTRELTCRAQSTRVDSADADELTKLVFDLTTRMPAPTLARSTLSERVLIAAKRLVATHERAVAQLARSRVRVARQCVPDAVSR